MWTGSVVPASKLVADENYLRFEIEKTQASNLHRNDSKFIKSVFFPPLLLLLLLHPRLSSSQKKEIDFTISHLIAVA